MPNGLLTTVLGFLATLTAGSYGYTYKQTKDVVYKNDIKDIKDGQAEMTKRIDEIYKILVEKRDEGKL